MIYLNGEYVDNDTPVISHLDCGLTTGIGIFDSMLAKDTILIHGREHYERICHDVKCVIGIELEVSFKAFEKICHNLIKENNLENGFVRIRTTVTGGVVNTPLSPCHTPTILIMADATTSPDEIKSVRATVITDYPRIAGCVLENCKRLDYTRSYTARRKAESMGAEDAILINTDGNIACGTTSNIFIEENGVLITPPLNDGVLAGVTRRKIIEERDVREESISIERLKFAEKIYLTNSFIGLREVILS